MLPVSSNKYAEGLCCEKEESEDPSGVTGSDEEEEEEVVEGERKRGNGGKCVSVNGA